MPTLSGGIHLALQAVLSHTHAIEIIEHNVANANTPGYRRQTPVLATLPPIAIFDSEFGVGAGQKGSGVTVERIQRFTDEYFDSRFRVTSGETQKWAAGKEVLSQLEVTLAEISDDGLPNKMDTFWAGWQLLASDPDNLSLRAELLDDARSLSDAFRRRYEQMSQLRSDQNQAVQSRVDEINSVAGEIAHLNGEITRVLSLDQQPNDLLDRRDLLLDRLAEISGGVSFPQKNGDVMVAIGGHVLVVGTNAIQLETQPDPNNNNLYKIVWPDGQNLKPPSGELNGIFYARDEVISKQMSGLDELASNLISLVNGIHQTGYGMDDVTGRPFFAGDSAATIGINPDLEPAGIAAADTGGSPGNNTIAARISDLKMAKTLNGGTLNEFYNIQVTNLAVETRRAKENAYHNSLLQKALGDQRESAAGVSLDEEAANLIKYQRAYQAAARVLTVYDEMLDRIINGMGVVGR